VLIGLIRNWRRRSIIKHSPITDEQWSRAISKLSLLKGLNTDEKRQLQELAILLIHYKSFEPAQGLELTQDMVMHIALQACLPILNLGLETYDGWVSVIVYPEAFVRRRRYMDEAGVEHEDNPGLSGESWQRGPVIVGWADAQIAGELDGHNVVIHEFAHKLDMLNGKANGFPPLHPGMATEEWVNAFSQAFTHFQHHCHGGNYSGIDSGIDCYGATSPAEFFAVLSEVFFERPEVLNHHYPAVYQQLSFYYRQDPLGRLAM
jgi:Mlc titration factor MtfA (ptsG expression regulator)